MLHAHDITTPCFAGATVILSYMLCSWGVKNPEGSKNWSVALLCQNLNNIIDHNCDLYIQHHVGRWLMHGQLWWSDRQNWEQELFLYSRENPRPRASLRSGEAVYKTWRPAMGRSKIIKKNTTIKNVYILTLMNFDFKLKFTNTNRRFVFIYRVCSLIFFPHKPALVRCVDVGNLLLMEGQVLCRMIRWPKAM